MKKLSTFLMLSLAMGFGATAFGQEEYDAEGGLNWLGDGGTEALGTDNGWGTDFGDSGWYEDNGWGESEGYTSAGYEEGWGDDAGVFGFGGEEGWSEDDYGYYNSDYDYDTDEGWFGDWYGESDEWF